MQGAEFFMRYQFICGAEFNTAQYWETFKTQLKPGDEISFPGYEAFGFGLLDLKDKLEFCRDNEIRLIDERWNLELNPARELEAVSFILSLKNETHRGKQLEGIAKALQLKHEGKGAYGRPLVILPRNFEQKIIQLKKEHKPLEAYRKTTGMKKSTFYKYAKMFLLQEKERAEKAGEVDVAIDMTEGNEE